LDDYIPLSVRAFAVPADWTPEMRELPAEAWQRGYRCALVYDTETTTDRLQSLQVGTYLLCRIDWTKTGPRVVPLEEGIFYPDDLAATDPDTLDLLRTYVGTHRPRVADDDPDAAYRLRLISRAEFCELRYRVLCELRGLVVGLNLPFDESRIAEAWTETRTRGFEGGFSLIHHTYQTRDGRRRESQHRPRTVIRTLDSRRARIKLARPRASDFPPTDGIFLDLRQLVYALTGEGHGLESACAAFGVPYQKRDVELGRVDDGLVTYAREDTRATMQLLEAALTEYDRRGLRLPPHRAFSAASLGKAALKQMGVRPILERQPDFPRELLGAAMVGFYGGRAECRIRCTPMPIVLVDFLSNYATVCCLIGAWEYFTRHRIDPVDVDPAEVEHWLERLAVDELYDRATWRDLNVLCWIAPGNQNILPARGRYDPKGQSDNISVTSLTLSEPVSWMLADLAAAKILHPEGKTAKILRAVRFQPAGQTLDGLRPLRIPGAGTIDPRTHDYFQRLVELRAKAKRDQRLGEETRRWVRQSLKTTVNATAYGINAEMNPRHHTNPITVTVDGLEQFTTKTRAPEIPGEYCFPPLAAMITAGARLLLAMLESEVTSRGGAYQFCDTDSMAIVATRDGGFVPCPGGVDRNEGGRECVRALTHQQVTEIVDGFRRLNPYNRRVVPGSILEVDDTSLDASGEIRDLWAWSIAAKRYATYTLGEGRPLLAEKYSEHGLGHLSDPRDRQVRGLRRSLAADVWQYILDAELGSEPSDPAWFDRPAVTQRTVSTPRILQLLEGGRRAERELRPFSFCNHAILHPDEPAARSRERFDLVAPFESAPRRWTEVDWVDVATGSTCRITTRGLTGRKAIRVRNLRDVVTLYRRKPEAKGLGPDGERCSRESVGLLQRRPVRELIIRCIGKETNQLEVRKAGLSGTEPVIQTYDHPGRRVYATLIRPALRAVPSTVLVEAAGLPQPTVAGLRAGRRPEPATLLKVIAGLAKLAPGAADTPDDLDRLLSRLARWRDHTCETRCAQCSATLTTLRAQYCSPACRQAAYRRRHQK
jgi:hypothetical protein